jgi:hypothetical protein
MKNYLLLFLLIFSITIVNAQEPTTPSPEVRKERLKFNDLPGAFIIDLGMTHYRFAPGSMELRLLASKGINVAYMYDIKISKQFSFSPGLGVSINNYNFKDAITLVDTLVNGENATRVDNIFADYKNLKKSKLNATYVDIPLELRWRSAEDINSFKIALGFKAGILASAHTKIKYKDDGAKIVKRKEDFNLERFRYGVYGRVGYGIFSLYGYYSLSNLFQDGKAPEARSIVPYTIGISIAAF